MSDALNRRLETMTIEQLYDTYCQPQESIVLPSSQEGPHVTSLILYPVKGCMAFPVTAWPMYESGLYLDRHWCIKSTKTGKYLNIARQMDTIIIHSFVDLSNRILIMAAPGMDKNLLLPIYEDEFTTVEGAQFHSLVMDGVNLVNAFADCGDEAASWVNEALNLEECRLLRQIQLRSKKLSLAYDSHVQLMNVASLHSLAKGIAREQGFLTTSLSELCLRFRPNIVVAGFEDSEEDRINAFSIRGVKLKSGEPVERCKAVNIDLQRYDYETYPLKYLVKAGKGKAYFGQHTFVDDYNCHEVLRVGDKVIIHTYKADDGC